MPDRPSLLDELRTEYEASRRVTPAHADVEGFQQIDARMRKAFRWLEKAIAYLDGLKPAINHRFDLGHGMVFDEPRFGRGFVGQHERRIVGFPVLDEINVYYVVSVAKAVAIDVGPESVALAEKTSMKRACNTRAAVPKIPKSGTNAGFRFHLKYLHRFRSTPITKPAR
jgi:hypothetical protein